MSSSDMRPSRDPGVPLALGESPRYCEDSNGALEASPSNHTTRSGGKTPFNASRTLY